MRFPALPSEKRLTAARVSGLVSRLTAGPDDGLDLVEKLAQLWELTRDPQVLGHELGRHLAEEYPNVATERALILLWVAGADRAAAERMAEWQQERRIREQGGPRT